MKTVSINSGNFEKQNAHVLQKKRCFFSHFICQTGKHQYQKPTTPNAFELLQIEYLIPCR